MKGQPPGVKWAPEGASASHNFPGKTASAAPMATFTTLSASVSSVWLPPLISGVFTGACSRGEGGNDYTVHGCQQVFQFSSFAD